jgi:hypothetical protein
VIFLKDIERGVFLVGLVDADRDHLKIALAIHAMHGHQIWQLGDARAAPGGPDIDEEQLFGVVAGQTLEADFVDGLDIHRLRVRLFKPLHRVCPLVGPLG